MSISDIRDAFFQECEDLLEALSEGFRRMDAEDQDVETVHAVFRAVHSIKGGAGAFALDDLVGFAHAFETVLDRVRSGDLQADAQTMRLFYRAGDHLSDLVAAARDGVECSGDQGAQILAELELLAGDAGADDGSDVAFEPMTLDFGPLPLPAAAPAATRWRIAFTPTRALYASGNDPALLFRALAKLGSLQVQADPAQLPDLDGLDPQEPHLRWTLELTTEADQDDIASVFEFVEGMCGLEIAPLGGEDDAADPVIDLGAMFGPPPGALEAAVEATPDPAADPAALAARGGARPDAAAMPQPTIRVNLDRVDRLINLVGELVIKEAMLSQSIAALELPPESDVNSGLDGLKQLAGEIQEGVMAIRAQPVKAMFQRMFRIVREAADATGKQVRLEVIGDQTEVDKTVIERLVDPLTHMIRNAVDHGLESPEDRRAAGKPAEGRVVLSAAHRSGRVMIEIVDDGAGVNRPRVRELAEKKGLISPGAELSPAEIDNLLFLPGFSSKDKVSALSGRGVGLDVAKSEIHALGGRVNISSQEGRGTTFSISLPLTLAVLEGMVIEVGGQTMILPITAIHETLQPSNVAIHPLGRGGRVLVIRGDLVPLIDLGAALGLRSEPRELRDRVLLLVQADNGRRCALVVDHIHDQRQVVIKSLESNYGHVPGIAAATILGDGRIALIIDPDEIISGGAAEALPADLQLAAMG